MIAAHKIKLLGFSPSEMAGKTVGELGPFEDIELNKGTLSEYKGAAMSAMKSTYGGGGG